MPLSDDTRARESESPNPVDSEFGRFFRAALSIVQSATRMGIQLRLLGATAIYYQCPRSTFLTDVMTRKLTDLDFVTLSKYMAKIPDLFSSLHFVANERVNALYGAHRQVYMEPTTSLHVDIFFDKLSFNHVIDFRGRLELDPVTISLADLLLEKLQIVRMSEKDAKDVIVLVHEHDFGHEERGSIDGGYIVDLLSNDWGFYCTFTTNLKKVMEFASNYPSLIEEDKRVVQGRLEALLQKLQSSHKSMKWTMRSRLGTKAKWYDEAEVLENRE